jgi:hypothetical protein
MACRRPVLFAALAAGLLALHPGVPAQAAVRSCAAPQSSGIVSAATEREGTRLAIDRWRAKARKFGANFSNWSVAANKALKCVRGKPTGFDCVAIGSPCVIKQNPNRTRPSNGAIET